MAEPRGYALKTETVTACGADLELCSLLDRQQYYDPDGAAELEHLSPEMWPLFGVLWPSARVLAGHMVSYPLAGQRILEVGCGLALASLVVHRRHGDVTASDCHPLVPEFLARNLALNALGPLPYRAANWWRTDPSLGRFDVIIGSDVLYERAPAAELSRFLDEHLEADGRILLVDPNRGQRVRFTRDMEARGFGLAWTGVEAAPGLTERYRGRLLQYAR
jgi:predicted nicotinamide N-methyase